MDIVFKNMEKSDLAKEIISSSIEAITSKFPKRLVQKISVILSMDNSPVQAGPDLFGVKVIIGRHRRRPIILEKRAHSLYVATKDVCEALIESLNRASDRSRVIHRKISRKMKGLQ